MRKVIMFLAWSLALILIFTVPVFADMGLVPPPDVWVYEPGQKAIVAWNGTDEIIILSIDLYATESTTVLSILPLPSEPKAEEGKFDSFVKVQRLLDRHNYLDRWGIESLAAGQKATSVEVIFHEKIGAHDITVVKAGDTDEFLSWANGFLTGKGIDFQISSSKVEDAVSDYIMKDINYFVFDLTEIGTDTKSREPVVYTFKSDSLYFPLKISSLAEGVTSINLFTITYDKPETTEFSAIKFKEPIQFTLTSKDLLDIDERIAEFFKSTTWLTAASYDGDLDNLSFDLEVRVVNETRVMYQRLEEMEVKIETTNYKIEALKTKLTILEKKLTDLTDLTEKRLSDLTLEIQKNQKASLTWVMIGIVIGVLGAIFLFKGSKRI